MNFGGMDMNKLMQQAQKMINLYRALEDFGDDFVEKYNQELLQIPGNAELMLTALVGGVEVRQYLDYLRNQNDKNKHDNNSTSNERSRGYLPGPESDISASSDKEKVEYITQADFEKFKAEQTNLINQLMQRLAQKNETTASPSSPVNPPTEHAHTAAMDYSEIIEEKQPGSDAMAGFNNGGK